MDLNMKHTIDVLLHELRVCLDDCRLTVYIYGSVAYGDFRLGLSDIDILVLAGRPLTSKEAERLVGLRGELTAREMTNQYYRLFEGGILSLDGFLSGADDRVVYWGTNGERICERYELNSLELTSLMNGILLCGDDIRGQLRLPDYSELTADIRRHYETIRKYARLTRRSLHSFGWLFDIARGIYTLRYGGLISKTAAARWALESRLCPDLDLMKYALDVRLNPLGHMDDTTLDLAARLGEPIQRFADILGRELSARERVGDE